MQDLVSLFREYARLDLKRMTSGLWVPELERWMRLRHILDREFRGAESRVMVERRSSTRVPTRLRCSYESGQALRKAAVTQLATGGVFIATDSPLPIDTALVLRLRIEDSGAEIEIEGVVVSNNFGPDHSHNASGMGVRFSKVSAEMIEAISDLYAHEVERVYLGKDERPDATSSLPPS